MQGVADSVVSTWSVYRHSCIMSVLHVDLRRMLQEQTRSTETHAGPVPMLMALSPALPICPALLSALRTDASRRDKLRTRCASIAGGCCVLLCSTLSMYAEVAMETPARLGRNGTQQVGFVQGPCVCPAGELQGLDHVFLALTVRISMVVVLSHFGRMWPPSGECPDCGLGRAVFDRLSRASSWSLARCARDRLGRGLVWCGKRATTTIPLLSPQRLSPQLRCALRRWTRPTSSSTSLRRHGRLLPGHRRACHRSGRPSPAPAWRTSG